MGLQHFIGAFGLYSVFAGRNLPHNRRTLGIMSQRGFCLILIVPLPNIIQGFIDTQVTC
jgi:hypothetical protein